MVQLHPIFRWWSDANLDSHKGLLPCLPDREASDHQVHRAGACRLLGGAVTALWVRKHGELAEELVLRGGGEG